MKNIILILILLSISCQSQQDQEEIRKIDLSSQVEMNYVFSRMFNENTVVKEVYGGGLLVKIFEISDSKITPEYFSESDEFLSSYIISVSPDGDYYVTSKLYKIEGLIYPNIVEIEETEYPNFTIKIEYGLYNQRKAKNFKITGG